MDSNFGSHDGDNLLLGDVPPIITHSGERRAVDEQIYPLLLLDFRHVM